MKHRSAVLAILLAAAVAPRAQDRSIQVDTVFVDRHGKPVRDIRRDEVEVWVAGYRMPLQQFMAVTPEDEVRSRQSIVLVLDDITVDPTLVPRLRDAGKQMVARMTPRDEMAIVSLSGGEAVRSTNDPVALTRALDNFNQRASGVTRRDMFGEQVLRTVTTVSQHLAESGARRRTIVGLGSGWVFDTPLPPPTNGRELGPEWVEAMRAMAAANVTLYVIDPGGVGRVRLTAGDAGFARESGGFAFLNTNDMRAAADQIMTEGTTYYILEIANPPMFRGAPLREVDVKVKRSGVSARARRAIVGVAPAPR